MPHASIAKHRSSVKFANVKLPGGTPLPEGWRLVSRDPFAVEGPCPTCLGDAVGPAIDFGDESVERDIVASVVAECRCGYEHGKADSSGCGRFWEVVITDGLEDGS